MRLRFLTCLTLAANSVACAYPRNIFEPVPGSFEITVPDSVREATDAAAAALSDEGLRVLQHDRRRGFVESDYVDIGAVKSTIDRSTYVGNERLVKFQFFARRTFGGTRVSGAAIYRPASGGGRAEERMVPAEHAGREVLTRLLARVDSHLAEERRKREERARRAKPLA
jgi:intein/homing endonuclease